MFKKLLPLIVCFHFFALRSTAQDDKELRTVRLETNPYQDPTNEFIALKEQLKLELAKKNEGNAALILQKMGNMCYHLGHYAQSFEYHLQAEKLFDQMHDYKGLAANANDIGLLYYYNKDIPKARKEYDKALSIYNRLNDEHGKAITYGLLGHLFEKQRQYDSAYYYQYTALKSYQHINDPKGVGKIYENLGSIYEDLARYDSAQIYFTNALGNYEKAGVEMEKIEVLNNMGDIYRKTGHYRQALDYSFKALELADKLKERYQISAAYRDIGKSYNLMHQNDSAFYYLELSRKHLLEVYSEESNKQIAFLQIQFEINKKNKEIERLMLERRINIIIGISVVIVILLLIVLGSTIISRQRLKIKNEKSLHEKEKQFYESQDKLKELELKARRLEEEQLKTEIKNRELEKEKLFADLKSHALEEANLKQQIETKTKELSTHTLHIIQKNHLLEDLKSRLDVMQKDDKRDNKKQIREVIQQINQNFNNDKYWEEFSNTFEQIHFSFFQNLKQHANELTSSEIRLISLLKMNLNSNDTATILGISQDSLRVARYRLRKKLNLPQGENLSTFLQGLS